MAIARATGIVKRFEDRSALDHVDLVIEQGEVRGLLGPNGAGKTTLLRIMLGLVRPDAGELELFGRGFDPSIRGALDGMSGFVEEPGFYPYLSGRANLEVAGALDGGKSAAQVDEVLERVGLATRGGDRVAGYSTGMKQRLGIAAALLRSPRLLLLDEPTAGLDPAGVRAVGQLIRELSQDGVAVLVSSHQIVEVEAICDTFTILQRGHVVWAGTAAKLRAESPVAPYRLLTSDDERAFTIAQQQRGVGAIGSESGGLELAVQGDALDAYVLALGAAGVAVRRLELLASPVESMFFELTGEPASQADDAPEGERSSAVVAET